MKMAAARFVLRLPASTNLTEWAQKYGEGRDEWLKGTGKSGLTPISADFTGLPADQLRYRDILRHYQEANLGGYTTLDLVIGSNATNNTNVRLSSVSLIHPVFQINQWETGSDISENHFLAPLPGNRGLWEARNPLVWAILEPILRLASKFIGFSHLWPWWDALAFGPRKAIRNTTCERFFLRSPELAQSSRHQQRQFFMDKISFAIASGNTNSSNGMPARKWLGQTVYSETNSTAKVYLSYEMMMPLLRNDLTISERLTVQFLVLDTLVHEMAHAYGRSFPTNGGSEPYFEGESVSELGCSLINAIFGGNFHSQPEKLKTIFELKETRVFATTHIKNWPYWGCQKTSHDPDAPCLDPEISNEEEGFTYSYIVPVSWVSDISQQRFWDINANQNGIQACYPNPLVGQLRTDFYDGAAHFDHSDMHEPVGVQLDDSDSDRDQTVEVDANTRTILNALGEAQNSRINEIRYLDRLFPNGTFNGISIPGSMNPAEDLQLTPALKIDLDFDSAVFQPAFNRIRNHITSGNPVGIYAIDEWTPMFLVLKYINATLAPAQAISREEWYQFLVYCQSMNSLFYFYRMGDGVLKVNRNGWPPAAAPIGDPVQRFERYMRRLVRMNRDRFEPVQTGSPDMSAGDGTTIPSAHEEQLEEDVYNNFMELLREDNDESIEVREKLENNNYELNRQLFHTFLDFCNQRQILFALGPGNIVRRRNKGWK